ncbi:transcription regulator, probable [Anaerovibrio sp. JC8]|uniref:helix-turn-helix domain-containing protein n=1 Tax=Anaerovibrio sp. JC8 TaxID=1240085 RepID=UPI000A0B95DF|nr:helix-turn-helix transcriptional regulator [Anaerovibrio sp. JC8]ORT99936.1 transcription regulator, probable [Anaerovibrio sp. JC8]
MNKQYKEAVNDAKSKLVDYGKRHVTDENNIDEWDALEKKYFTSEEISESDLRVALISELIAARNEKGITQKQLEELSGVKQPVIARMERGSANSTLATVLKVLAPLGKTLRVVPIER